MREHETEVVEHLRALVSQRLCKTMDREWVHRKQTACELLKEIYAAWWKIHTNTPDAYQLDLDALNALAGWSGKHMQLSFWKPNNRARILMPPKFFGGNPNALTESFVASISLNHAAGNSTSGRFGRELEDCQGVDAAYDAHADYFRRPYAYKRFFWPSCDRPACV